MKAARLVAPKRFEFVDAPVPTPKEDECLIKLEKVSICGSDIRNTYGPVLPEERYPLNIGVPCHECAGVVVESRSEEYREGQRVIVLPTSGTGGLAEYLVGQAGRMIPLPDHGDLSEWVMCQPSGTVLYSCQKMGNVLGKNVLILGQGAIGLSFTMITSKQGAREVIAADLLDYRLEWAKKLGATQTINPDKHNIEEAVQEITRGQGADIVVEAAGYVEAFNMCFRLVRQFGMVIIFGVQTDKMVPLEHHLLLDKQCTIIPTTGARSGDPTTHIKEIVRLRERGWIDPALMITHRLSFNDVKQAYDMYEQRLDNIVKVVMSI